MIDRSRISRLRPIYLPQPVNRQHSLNQSLVAWWKCLPGLTGSQYFYDLLGLNKGTLTNMGSGSGWGGSPAPGGWGSLRFVAASSTYIDAGTSAVFDFPTQNFSVAFWVNPSSLPVGGFTPVSRGLYHVDGWYIFVDSSGRVWIAEQSSGVERSLRTTTGISAGSWTRVVAVRTGTSTAAIYFNGVPKSTTTGESAFGDGATSTRALAIGGPSSTGSLTGQEDSVKIWSRALTAAEVVWEYRDELNGCLDTLNRLGGLTAAQQQMAAFVNGEASFAGYVEG